MKKLFLLLLLMFDQAKAQSNVVDLSQKLLYAAKVEQRTDEFFEKFRSIPMAELQKELYDDQQKKTFWINIYNALVLTKLKADQTLYQNRSAFYSTKIFDIAGQQISLDDIEHGILRRSKHKYSLGYFGRIFVNSFEKKMRVQTLDYRIHFALNCGAKSCPPIAFYTSKQLDHQLDLATQNYLKQSCTLDQNKIHLPMIFSWFRGDFGGKKGIIKLLKKSEIIPKNLEPQIIFDPYNWQIELNNYFEN